MEYGFALTHVKIRIVVTISPDEWLGFSLPANHSMTTNECALFTHLHTYNMDRLKFSSRNVLGNLIKSVETFITHNVRSYNGHDPL